MDNREIGSVGGVVLASGSCETERWEVVAWPCGDEGGVVVAEHSRGDLTLGIYDEEEHEYRIELGRRAAGAVAGLIGVPEVFGALAMFFSEGEGLGTEVHLSDLMDLCDRTSVPYAFASRGSGQMAAMRPEGR